MFDLETGKQRHIVVVALDAIDVARHDGAHEGLGLLEYLVGIDQDFADFRLEIVADGANDQTAFQVDQEGAVLLLGSAFDGGPQLHQVVEIPLQLFSLTADGSGTGDQAHAVGHFELVHGIAEFGTLIAINAPGNTTAARIVRHQNQVTAGEGDIGGQGGALVATLVLVDLNNEFLAFLQRFVDLGTTNLDARLEIGTGNFLERQKAMAVRAVVDEAGFETGFDAGDDRLVDVALALFLGGRFNVQVNQFLTINNGDTEFFSLCRIEKHAFHYLGLQRTKARCNGVPCRQRQFQLSGCVIRKRAKTMMKVLINKQPRYFLLKGAT